MRAQGSLAEAESLTAHSLTPLVASLQTESESPTVIEERFAATMAVESERVAQAAVLAELLAPMLGGRAGGAATPAPASRVAAPTLPVPVTSPPAAPARPAGTIADFLDEMLAQEAAPARTRGTPERRAS